MDFEELLRDAGAVAHTDQLRAGLRQLAEVMRAYHVHLVGLGFDQVQALTLVLDYQRAVLGQAALRDALKEEGR